MRLEGNFYKTEQIEVTEDGVFKAIVEIFHEHPIFDGHFPQQAVVPGVCTLAIIKETLGKALQREVSFKTIKECKYVSSLLPHVGLKIVLDFVITDAAQLKGIVKRHDNGEVVLKLKATF